METFENLQLESEGYFKLQATEKEAELTKTRYSKNAMKAVKDAIGGGRLSKPEFLPSVQQDIVEIVRNIIYELHNPAAHRLATTFLEAVDRTSAFPYAAPSYIPICPLKHKYRK